MKIFLDANICLDLLDTTRQNSKKSVEWYLANKDKETYEFFFSADFITTFYFVLTERKKSDPRKTLQAIDMLCEEISPHYLEHTDFYNAKVQFFKGIFTDFEDLLMLNSALRLNANRFVTNDKKLLRLETFHNIKIITT